MTDALYSLPDTLVPLPDESMAGLVVRYAALYGFPSPERLFDRLRLKRAALPTLMRLDPLSEEGGAVAALLNLEPDRARAMSNWHPHAFEITVGGHVLNTDLVDVFTRQCCPLCLRDSAHHRASWFIAALPVCPEHGLELECACPRCGKRLNWSGLGPHVCGDAGCGFDLRDSKPRPVARLVLGS